MSATTQMSNSLRRVRAGRILAVLAVSALAFSACSSSEDTSSPSGGEGSKGTIGVSFPTVEGSFFTAALYGITEEAAELGYGVTIVSAGGYANVDTQVGQVDDLVQRGVSGILIGAADPAVLAPSIDAAIAGGIPVVAAGEVLDNAVSSVSASHCQLGTEMAEGVASILPDGGTLAGLTGPAGAFWAEDRWECFTRDLPANVTVIAEQNSEPSVAEGLTLAEDILQSNPDINVFYGVDDTVGVGAAQAVQQGPGCGEVAVVTAILGPQAQALLEEGCIDYLVAQQVVEIGRQSVRTLVEAIEGGTPAKSIEIPNITVTPGNVATVDIATLRQPEGWKPNVS